MSTDHEQPTVTPAPPPDSGRRQGGIPRLRPVLFILLAFIAVAVVYGFASGELGPNQGSDSPPLVTVTYEVTSTAGSGTADITYSTPSGISQQQGAGLPLTGDRGIRVTVPAGTFVSISAQLSTDNGDNGPTDVTCRITAGGRVVAENTSSGQFAIASCDGTA